MKKNEWRAWLNGLTEKIGNMEWRQRRRAPYRRLQVERLEDRLAPATNITVIAGAAGTGTLDHFLSATQGTITTSDDPGDTGATLSSGALVGVNATTNISIAADAKITFNDLSGTVTLQTGSGNSAAFGVTTGAISFSNTANTLATAGGSIFFTAGTNLTLGTLNAGAGSIALKAGTGIGAAGAAINTQAATLAATTSTGGIFIANTGALAVGTVNSISGVTDTGASGDIVLTSNNGSLSILTDGDTVRGPGNITLKAFGSTSDIDTGGQASLAAVHGTGSGAIDIEPDRDLLLGDNNGLGSVRSDSGTITLHAFRDLIINGNAAVTIGSGTGELDATSERNFTMQAFPATTMTTTPFFTSSGGVIQLMAANLNHTLTVDSAGATAVSSSGGNIVLTADIMTLKKAINAGAGVVTLEPVTLNREIDLGTNPSTGNLGLAQADLNQVTASVLRIGSTTNPVDQLSQTGNIKITAPITDVGTGWNTLSLITNGSGAITQGSGDSLTVANLQADGGLGTTLNDSGNKVIVLAGASNNAFTFVDSASLTIGSVDTGLGHGFGTAIFTKSSSVGITVTGGLTMQQPISTIGFASTAGADVTLSSGGNILLGAVNATGHTATITSTGGAIIDANDPPTGTNNVTAATVTFSAMTGIGSVSPPGDSNAADAPIEIVASTLAFTNSGSGKVQIINLSGDLSASGTNAASAAAIVLTAQGGSKLTVNSGNMSSTNGDITLSADGMLLTGTVNAGNSSSGGTVTLQPFTSGLAIDLGGLGTGTRLSLTDADLDNVTAHALHVGDALAGTFNVTAAINSEGSYVDFAMLTGGNITVGAAVSTAGNVTVIFDAANTGHTATINAAITGSSAEVLSGTGIDTFNVTAVVSMTPLQVIPGAVTNSLNYFAQGKAVGTVPGVFRTFGLQTVKYTNIKGITVNNAAGVDAFYGPDTADRATAFAGLNGNERFVQAVYLDALGRAGAKAELDGWTSLFSSLTQAQAQATIAKGVEGSLEGRDHLVKSWYFHYLGRTAKNGEEIGWVNLLLSGQTEEQVLSDILAGDEFYAKAQLLVSSGTPDERYIEALYLKLMNRTPGASEIAGWTAAVAQPGGRQSVALSFLQSFEFRLYQFDGYYNALLHRLPDSGGLSSWAGNGLDFLSARIAFEASLEFYVRG